MTWTRNRPLGLVYLDEEKSHPGYTLFTIVRGHYANLLDWRGCVVHRWHHPEGIQHAKMIANGNLLIQTLPPEEARGAENIGGSAGAIVELDWESNTVWEHRDDYMHHDYERLPSGNTLYIRWEELPAEVSAQVRGGGHHKDDPEWMWADSLREVTPGGETVREWRSWEHFDFEEDVICPLESRKEWTHANSLAVGPDGRWLLSFRLTDTVAIVDPESGEFTWKWGPRHLSHQHAATWLEDGRISIFDNGCHRFASPTFSRVIEIDPATNETGWRYLGEPIVGFYSFMGSGASRLANGNVFITEAATGRLFEVTAEGETVWEYVSPFLLTSKFGPTPALFRAHRFDLDDSRFAGKELSPERYAELNRRIAARELATGDED